MGVSYFKEHTLKTMWQVKCLDGLQFYQGANDIMHNIHSRHKWSKCDTITYRNIYGWQTNINLGSIRQNINFSISTNYIILMQWNIFWNP
jgi:hypothetical protein